MKIEKLVIPPPTEPDAFTLTITQAEAEVLHCLLGKTCGVGKHSDLARGMFYALDKLGVQGYGSRDFSTSPSSINVVTK